MRFSRFVVIIIVLLLALGGPWYIDWTHTKHFPLARRVVYAAASTDTKWPASYNMQITSACNGTNCFGAPQGAWEINATLANVQGLAASSGTLAWKATLSGTAGGTSYSVQLSQTPSGGAASNVGTCTIVTAATTCTATGVSIALNDLLAWSVTASGATTTRQLSIDAQWTPTNPNDSVLMGNTRGSNLANANFAALTGAGNPNATASQVYIVNPLAGTTNVTKMCAKLATATGGANTRDIFFVTNGGTTSTLTHHFVNADSTTAQCDTHTVTSTAGDTWAIYGTLSGAASSAVAFGVVYNAATSGDYIMPFTSGSNMSTAAQRYLPLATYDQASGTMPEANEDLAKSTINSDVKFTGFAALMTAAPGAGASNKFWTYNLRQNKQNSNNNFRCVIFEVATTCLVTGVMIPSDGDTADTQITPSATAPTAARAAVSWAATMNFTAPTSCSNVTQVINFSAGSNGVALAADTKDGITVPLVDASTIGPTGQHTWINTNITGMTYSATAVPPVSYTFPAVCGGTLSPTTVGLAINYGATGIFGLQIIPTMPAASLPSPQTGGGQTAAITFSVMEDFPEGIAALNIDHTNAHHTTLSFLNVPLGSDGVNTNYWGMESCGLSSYTNTVTTTIGMWSIIAETITADTTKNNWRAVYDTSLNLRAARSGVNPSVTVACNAGEVFKDFQAGNASGAVLPGVAHNIYIGWIIIQFSGATPETPLLPTVQSGKGGLLTLGVGDHLKK